MSIIRINHVHGGNNRDKSDLETLYFDALSNPGEYFLFETGDNHMVPTAPSPLRSGQDFQFIRGGVLWMITNFFIDGRNANGNWFNARHPEADDGSFQAQAGGTTEGEGDKPLQPIIEDEKKIKIDVVRLRSGVAEDRHALKQNFFYEADEPETYQFRDRRTDKVIPTEPPLLRDGVDFSFTLPELHGIKWNVTDFVISKTHASGNWNNDLHTGDDDGSFQAQAGGREDEESAASAGAY